MPDPQQGDGVPHGHLPQLHGRDCQTQAHREAGSTAIGQPVAESGRPPALGALFIVSSSENVLVCVPSLFALIISFMLQSVACAAQREGLWVGDETVCMDSELKLFQSQVIDLG